MSNAQDINSKAQTEPGESPKAVAQTKISSTDKDALSDSALDGVSGGALLTGAHYTAGTGPSSQGPGA
jgi:hypothetical protein